MIRYVLIALLISNTVFAQKQLAGVQVSNPLATALKDAIIEIPIEAISSKIGHTATDKIVIKNAQNKELVYQWVKDGKEDPQSLLIQLDLPASRTVLLKIVEGTPTVFKSKTFGRFVPERYDDFAWENDRVAFRMYGPALQNRPDNAYGIDVWSKRTTELIINKWYKLNDYHHDNGEGQDYYNVGFTLGAGDLAPYIKDSIYYSKNYTTWKVLDNGPLRTCFELTYNEWNAGDYKVKAVKKISLDAGSQLNKIRVIYDITGTDSIPVVIGIIKRSAPGVIHLDEKQGIMGYWEPQISTYGMMGIGCVFTSAVNSMLIAKQQLLTKTFIHNGKPFTYYSGAAWNKAALITDSKEWNEYLSAFHEQLLNPLTFTIK